MKYGSREMGGTHTTCIQSAEPVVGVLRKSLLVKRFFLGHIKPGLGPTSSVRVKVRPLDPTRIVLDIRGSGSAQQIRVHLGSASSIAELVEELERKLSKQRIAIYVVPKTGG